MSELIKKLEESILLSKSTFDSKKTPNLIEKYLNHHLEDALKCPTIKSCLDYLNIPLKDIRKYPTIIDKIKNNYPEIVKEVEEDEIKDLLLSKTFKALSYIDDESLADSKPRDLAQIAVTLIEKYRLMDNKSTNNVQINQLQTLINNLENPIKP